MKVKNKSRLFVKSKNIKNIAIPFLFILTFLLVLFNKADYFLVNKMKSTSIDVVNPISKDIYYPLIAFFLLIIITILFKKKIYK